MHLSVIKETHREGLGPLGLLGHEELEICDIDAGVIVQLICRFHGRCTSLNVGCKDQNTLTAVRHCYMLCYEFV